MENTTKILMSKISRYASMALLLLAVASFLALIVFKADYYHNQFLRHWSDSLAMAMGISIAIIAEGVRFSLLLSSAEDARVKNWWGFFWGIIGSLGMLAYEIMYVCNEVGEYWSTDSTSYTSQLKFLAYMGMLLELRLCLLLKGSYSSEKEQEKDEGVKEKNNSNSTQKVSPAIPFFLQGSQNGAANTVK